MNTVDEKKRQRYPKNKSSAREEKNCNQKKALAKSIRGRCHQKWMRMIRQAERGGDNHHRRGGEMVNGNDMLPATDASNLLSATMRCKIISCKKLIFFKVNFKANLSIEGGGPLKGFEAPVGIKEGKVAECEKKIARYSNVLKKK